MGFWKKVEKAAKKAGKIGSRMPSTEELIMGKKRKAARRTHKRRR